MADLVNISNLEDAEALAAKIKGDKEAVEGIINTLSKAAEDAEAFTSTAHLNEQASDLLKDIVEQLRSVPSNLEQVTTYMGKALDAARQAEANADKHVLGAM